MEEEPLLLSAFDEAKALYVGFTRKVLDMMLSGYLLVLDQHRELLLHRDWKGVRLELTHPLALVFGQSIDDLAITLAKASMLLPSGCPFVAVLKEDIDTLVSDKELRTSVGNGIILGFAETMTELLVASGIPADYAQKLEVLRNLPN